MTQLVEGYPDLARRILDRSARLGRTRLVAVDGPSCAGKTVFAGRLAAALAVVAGGAPPVVQTDDLLDGWADQFTFWPRLEEWVLAPLRTGQAGRYRRYNWLRQEFTPAWITVPPAPVVILEGVSSARAAITADLTFAVFVSAPSKRCRERALARDGVALLPYLDAWRRGEQAHFTADGTADRADLLVDGASELPDDSAGHYVRWRGRASDGPWT